MVGWNVWRPNMEETCCMVELSYSPCLDLGRLCAKVKAEIAKYGVKSTHQWKSKTGKKKLCGSKALSATGSLDSFHQLLCRVPKPCTCMGYVWVPTDLEQDNMYDFCSKQ